MAELGLKTIIEEHIATLSLGDSVLLCHESVIHVFKMALKGIEGVEIITQDSRDWEVLTREEYEERIK